MRKSTQLDELIRTLPRLAQEKHAENRKYFERLKKKTPKNLDYVMESLHAEVFDKTDCLECANCCKTTGPLFTSADIERISRHLRMRAQHFTQRFLRIDEDNDHVLQQLPCPFLSADNSCDIYDVRPKACREFPHTDRKKFQQIASHTLKNVAICPAAFRIVEAMKKRLPL